MKTILGLDLGTNSIGWALIQQNETEKTGNIIAAGSRILPMSQDILGKFDSGVSISQTAERTGFRGIRRLRERHLLRRERLHRVLNILGFLPEHYAQQIDFEKYVGQFIPEMEPKLPYAFNDETKTFGFIFKKSFEEMLQDFAEHQPQLVEGGNKVPYDWAIYYLRKKALKHKIEKEELAWLLLNFNQKRGYYQLRGEDEEENDNKLIEFHTLKVKEVTADEPQKGKSDIWYNVILENGWVYRRSSKIPLFDWKDKVQEFIVTADLNDDKTIKTDKEGKEKRSFKAVDSEKDWVAIKKSTEEKIGKSHKTVGQYIYDTLLQNPHQKIKGKLVRVIERKFYKAELDAIIKTQQEFHEELKDQKLYHECLEELYENNEAHRNSIGQKDFRHLFLNDIIFYQRPLKSKKSLISNCKFETRTFIKDGKKEIQALKGIAKSHPLFQEFRLWQFHQNLKIYQKEKEVDGKLEVDVNITDQLLKTEEDCTNLFDWMNNRKEIDQKAFLKYPAFNLKKNTDNYRWNYVEDKLYPANETRSQILTRLGKVENVPNDFLTKEKEEALWHILYSVEDKNDIQKALTTFAGKNGLSDDFIDQFKKFPRLEKEYASYSAKAIKKFLPLMRLGKYWREENIHPQTKERIEKIINGEYDEKIRDRVRDKAFHLTNISHFQNLPQWLVSYIIYDRHSEDGDIIKWATADKIELLQQHSLRNPIVEQVINETLQVVRDIWKHHGNGEENFFDEIHIELGREMKNPKKDREKITKQVTENENTNLRLKALLIELLNGNDVENVRPYSPMQLEILKIYEEGVLSTEEGNIPDDIAKIAKLAQPTSAELLKYKLWIQQKYKSPYTGKIIPLNKLFTRAYDIEHIIPQSRYFDDSMSNKVICEVEVNFDKGNSTAYEYIKNNRGKKLALSGGNEVTLLTIEEYEDFVKSHYTKTRGKMKKLLMDDIPEAFIQRQLNDSRYISKVVKSLLSNIVREEGEQEAISKNVIASNGAITSELKQHWGLNDIWNEIITPRFERLNQITNTTNFGEWTNKEGKQIFQTAMPLELQKGFSRKRIDHRHHALDAIVIAVATRSHINYLNNESALGKKSKEEKDKKRYDLRSILCKKTPTDNKGNYKWIFQKPWETFTQEAKETLYTIIVSFKQNLRVINKTINQYQAWKKDENGNNVKELIRQTKGESWAIRKPMHKDTVTGLVQLKFKKVVALSAALDNWEMITDNELRKQVKKLIEEKYDKKGLTKFFKDNGNKGQDKDISKVEIYYWDKENVASRVKIDETFNVAMIDSITDSGIQKIMLTHLEKYNEEKNGKIIEHPELAFSPDGLNDMNKNIVELNGGKPHHPIYKVRTYEPKGNKFSVGHTGNKKDKYVEAAKGTNLFFAIYRDEKGKRNYETIPLNLAIERQKQGLISVPETNEQGHQLMYHLSPNDLVYVPTDEERENMNSINFGGLNKDQVKRIYKIVSFTNNRLYAIPYSVAKSIIDKVEFSQLNKLESSLDKQSLKDVCIKLKTDRLGDTKLA
ncbi:MAG TPA: HNH endonuclease domain-containing protein [Chitinophagaceae bacterium]|nr:HNH endonuclease domain-containing protein [Chitinophagaceae bacterium]